MVNSFRQDAEAANFAGILVDFDHFSLDGERRSEAAGWITALECRGARGEGRAVSRRPQAGRTPRGSSGPALGRTPVGFYYLYVILAYLLVMTGYNIYRSRQVKSQDDFMVAGRSLSLTKMVFTLVCTWIGSGTFIAGAEYASYAGWSAIWQPAVVVADPQVLAGLDEEIWFANCPHGRPTTLRAAPGARVVVSGAQPVGDWQPLGGGIYTTLVVDVLLFGAIGITINRLSDFSLGEILAQLHIDCTDNAIRNLPVVEGGAVTGVLSFHDVAKAMLEEQAFENKMLKGYIKNWPA